MDNAWVLGLGALAYHKTSNNDYYCTFSWFIFDHSISHITWFESFFFNSIRGRADPANQFLSSTERNG